MVVLLPRPLVLGVVPVTPALLVSDALRFSVPALDVSVLLVVLCPVVPEATPWLGGLWLGAPELEVPVALVPGAVCPPVPEAVLWLEALTAPELELSEEPVVPAVAGLLALCPPLLSVELVVVCPGLLALWSDAAVWPELVLELVEPRVVELLWLVLPLRAPWVSSVVA